MYGRLLPETDRRISPQSVTAGFVLNAGLFLLLVAVSYPVAVGAILAASVGFYALGGAIRRSGFERNLQFCRGWFCLRLQLSVG